jgi:hypothetical protein
VSRAVLVAVVVASVLLGGACLYVFRADVLIHSGSSDWMPLLDDVGLVLFGMLWLAGILLVALLAQVLVAWPSGRNITRPFSSARVVPLSLLVFGVSAVGWILPYTALTFMLEEELYISEGTLTFAALPVAYFLGGLLALVASLVLRIRSIHQYNKVYFSKLMVRDDLSNKSLVESVLDELVPALTGRGWWSRAGRIGDDVFAIVYSRPYDERIYGRVIRPIDFATDAVRISPNEIARVIEHVIRNPIGQPKTQALDVASKLVTNHEEILWF